MADTSQVQIPGPSTAKWLDNPHVHLDILSQVTERQVFAEVAQAMKE
jgi:hypothetical protein